MARNFHILLDDIEGWIRSRIAQAEVISTPADLERYSKSIPREAHPAVKAAEPVFGPTKSEQTLGRALRRHRSKRWSQRFAFPSPMSSPYAENNICSGVLWHGDGNREASTAVVMMHGAFAPSFTAEKVISVPLLDKNVHMFTLTAPYHMERAPKHSKYSGQYLLSGDIPRLIAALIQSAAEVRALVAYLRTAGYETVVLFGTSMGGNVASQVLTMTKVEGGFLFIPAVDFAQVIEEASLARAARRSARAAGFESQEIERAMKVVTPYVLGKPLCGTSRVHIHYGTRDRQVLPKTVERLIEEWPGVHATVWDKSHRTMGGKIISIRNHFAKWLEAAGEG